MSETEAATEASVICMVFNLLRNKVCACRHGHGQQSQSNLNIEIKIFDKIFDNISLKFTTETDISYIFNQVPILQVLPRVCFSIFLFARKVLEFYILTATGSQNISKRPF